MHASLPMYDWPQVRAETDELWARVAADVRAAGVAAPAVLDRDSDLYSAWLRPDLLVSQTCGLPFVRRLRGRVTVVGAVDHGLPGIAAGNYCSRIVVRRGMGAAGLAAFAGRIAAYNSADSQSGAGALRHMVLPLRRGGRFFAGTLMTGGHVASILAVADGRADLAAIDAATWALALRHLPEAQALEVMVSTPPTPGLPLITAAGGPAAVLFAAFGAGLAALHPDQRAALGMQGIVPRVEADFDVVARWDREAVAAGYGELSEGSA